MSVPSVLGWAVIGVALYVPSAASVAAATTVLRVVRPKERPPRALRIILTIVVAVTLWYCVPILIHGYYGRAAH